MSNNTASRLVRPFEWTAAQCDTLRTLWGKLDVTLEQIAAAVGRSAHSVEGKASRMGLGKRAFAAGRQYCRHCGRLGVKSVLRRLCWRCCKTPEIRDQYEGTRRAARERGDIDYHPTQDDFDAATEARRRELGDTPRDKALAIVGHFGPATTYTQLANHLREDGLTITPEEFAAVMSEVFPPEPDWQEVLLRKRLVHGRVLRAKVVANG